MTTSMLPIDPYLPSIIEKLKRVDVLLLKSSTGSGKTTRLPWNVAEAMKAKVIVLEPRRLAAKLAAQRIAFEQNLTIGQEIGYHFRHERNLSSNSKLIFTTEGTFLKSYLDEIFSGHFDVIILDEFHERHIETDVAIAYLKKIVEVKKLKLIIMSATLDDKLKNYFNNTALVDIEAHRYPVAIHYFENRPSLLNLPLETKVLNALEKVSLEGDVLIFLPGLAEIKRVKDRLESSKSEVLILHGEMEKEEQLKVLGPSKYRKIILATNIAESSLTIPGVRIVIDSGIQREAVYSPWHGLKSLQDFPCPKSSLIQRAGRAGREAAGECFRLFSEQDYDQRSDFQLPAILKNDLSETYLFTRQRPHDLEWLDPPPMTNWEKAQSLNYQLGLIDEKSQLTKTGQEIANYPLELRLARVLLEAKGEPLHEKKKILRLMDDFLKLETSQKLSQQLQWYFNLPVSTSGPIEKYFLTGFIDQVALFRDKYNDFIHQSGKVLKPHPSLRNLEAGFYLIFDITKREEVMSLLPIDESWLFEIKPFPFSETVEVIVKPNLSLRRLTKIGSIPYETEDLDLNYSEEKFKLIESKVEHYFFQRVNDWFESPEAQKINFLLKHLKQIRPPYSLQEYFSLQGRFDWSGLDDYLLGKIQQEYEVELRSLPDVIVLAEKKIPIHYDAQNGPYVESYIQDFYGMKALPPLLNQKMSLTIKLLGPHKRPIQVTNDLDGFWKKTYLEFKKELERDYPRHHWPDQPWLAKPVLLKRHLS